MVVAAILACARPGGAPSPVGESPEAPVVSLDPVRPEVPLDRWVRVGGKEPSTVAIHWTDPDGTERVVEDAASADEHVLRLLGLCPDAHFAITVDVTLAGGEDLASELDFDTDPLPADFPDVRVDVAEPDRMEPGVTVVDVGSYSSVFVAMLDARGTVRWLLDPGTTDANQIWWEPDDRFLTVTGSGEIEEIDLDGDVLRTWAPAASAREGAIPVDVTSFHHDLVVDADGTFLALDRRIEVFPTFRTSYDDPALHATDALVLTDRAVRVDPDSGAILGEWDVSAALDHERIGYDSLLIQDDGSADWTHANAVLARPDGGVIVSLRHQDALLAFDADGAVDWIAANDANWNADLGARRLASVGDLTWFYHQHGPDLEPDGTLVLMDNGNWRTSPGEGPQPEDATTYSRVAAFAVDEAAGEIRQLWDWQPADAPAFSGGLGSATLLPATGDTLVDLGQLTVEAGQALADQGRGKSAIRLVELDPAHEVIWQVEIGADAALAPEGWSAFRAHRIPTPW